MVRHMGFHAALTVQDRIVHHAGRMNSERASTRRRIFLLVVLKLALVLSVVPFAFGQAPQPPATILLIRHAEKLTDGRMDLSPVGFERAKLIPKLFGRPFPFHHISIAIPLSVRSAATDD